MPVYDFTAEDAGLNYRTPQSMRIYNTIIDRRTLVQKTYECYGRFDKSELTVTGPFDFRAAIDAHAPDWLAVPAAP